MVNTNLTLDEHRAVTVGEILNLLHNNDRVACVRYTGYGKTYYIIKRLIDTFPNKQFLILVPAKSLIKIYNNLFYNDNVTIKTYQSLLYTNSNSIKENFSNIDYIICDEAHRLGRNKWRQSVKNAFDIINNGNTKIIGLTATPKRGDKIDIIEDFFNGIKTSRFDLLDGIQAGYLPKIDYVVAYCDLSDLDKEIYDERMEDIDRYEIDKLLNVSNIIKGNITKDKLKENLKVVLYVSRLKDIDTAKESCYKWFTEAFPDKNIKVFSLSSKYNDKENNNYLDEYSDDEDDNSIDIMVSCNKLNEGLHLPKCSIAILLRRTTSPIVYFQQIGRAINGGKPIIFDLVDNSSHIRQIENDFEQGKQKNLDLSIQINKDKKIFSECINLISEVKDIEDILNNYKNSRKKKTSKQIIEENKDSIIKEIKNSTYISIANKYGISDDYLSKWCRDIGIESIQANKNWNTSDKIRNEVNKLVREGLSLKEIADKLNIPYRNASYLKEKGISKKEKKRKNLKFLEQHYQEYTEKELCILLDVTRSTLNSYARTLNISILKSKHKENLKYIRDNCKDMTINELVEKTGMKESTVRSYITHNKLEHKSERKRSKSRDTVIDDDIVYNVLQMYKNDTPYTRIAENLNISVYNVKKILARNGYKMYMPTVTQDNIDRIIKMYKNNNTVRYISESLNMFQNNVELILIQEGLK